VVALGIPPWRSRGASRGGGRGARLSFYGAARKVLVYSFTCSIGRHQTLGPGFHTCGPDAVASVRKHALEGLSNMSICHDAPGIHYVSW
jgi:hypothetical protein